MKYIAPAIFAIIAFILIGGYFIMIAFVIETLLVKIIIGAIAAIILTSIIHVYIERVKEIREGKLDDYSEY